MYITSSQRYKIVQEVNRKASRIAAAIVRVFDLQSAVMIRKMVKQRINKDLKRQFEFGKIELLPESSFDKYIEALNEYQYFYRNQLFK